MLYVDIRNVKTKQDKISRTGSEEKRNLMDGILHNIEEEQNRNLKVQPKKVSWKQMTNEHVEPTKIQNPQTSTTS